MRRLAQENEGGPKGMKGLTKIDKDAERQLCLAAYFHGSDYVVCDVHVWTMIYFRSPIENILQISL